MSSKKIFSLSVILIWVVRISILFLLVAILVLLDMGVIPHDLFWVAKSLSVFLLSLFFLFPYFFHKPRLICLNSKQGLEYLVFRTWGTVVPGSVSLFTDGIFIDGTLFPYSNIEGFEFERGRGLLGGIRRCSIKFPDTKKTFGFYSKNLGERFLSEIQKHGVRISGE